MKSTGDNTQLKFNGTSLGRSGGATDACSFKFPPLTCHEAIRWLGKRLRDWLAAHLPARLFTDPALFQLYERRGWHITPVHYYQPIPDSRELSADLWRTGPSMCGVDINEQFQMELLGKFQSAFRSEYDRFPASSADPARFHFNQTSFCSVDAEILYCMIRYFKPRRMIEIGSGMSTLLAAEAIRKNETEGFPCSFTAIEPYPHDFLRRGIPGLTQLLETKVQSVPIERFGSLEASDILFIDSSHVIKTGGDVLYEYLNLIPSLKPGVVVHCHDIFLPADIPEVGFWSGVGSGPSNTCCRRSSPSTMPLKFYWQRAFCTYITPQSSRRPLHPTIRRIRGLGASGCAA